MIPFTRSTSLSFILNGLQLRPSCEHFDFHNIFNFESSVHLSIIDVPKGIATGISCYCNGRFVNREANRLRDEFLAMFHFNEALIPQMKKGGVNRVQLYDLSKDLKQQNDIAKKRPKLVARVKKQANLIYKNVMADAPDWPSK